LQEHEPRWLKDTPPPITALWQPAFYIGVGNRAATTAEQDQHLMGSARQVTQIGWVVTPASAGKSATTKGSPRRSRAR
jgi:hypothetical protein